MSNPIVSISNATIGYSSKKTNHIVAENVTLQVNKGEMVCLLGENGCGKSTLIRSISGMQPLLEGTILVDGNDMSSVTIEQRAKMMSVVFTDTVSVANMSVKSIVALGRFPYTSWYGTLTEKDEQIVAKAIEMLNLKEIADKDFSCLSDGEKQRTMIAKSLAQDTPFIVLDEPTAHLDLPNRIETMRLLRVLAHETGKAVVLSTHELELAFQIADTIWLMQKGGGVITGTPQELVEKNLFSNVFSKNVCCVENVNGEFVFHYSVQ
ncbi:MAG: ABC transporter ATP-binding protein [Bacteroidales bacterium]|nr:ABC transporter ATP-binding protein [Bacteroidales bacterium]